MTKTFSLKAGVIAGAVMLLGALALFSYVSADTAAVNFESPTYAAGNINGQDGWSKTGPYDVAVVANTYGFASFDAQTLRISNAVTSGSFGDQTFSKSLVNEAGETTAINSGFSGGVRQNHFEAQFDLASTMTTQQSGLSMSVSPDRGDGARMSYLRFEDQADGIHVFFDDYTVGFNETDIVTLNRTEPHIIKFVMDFVDGPANDVVKIYIDSVLEITGTSWEKYFADNQPAIAPPTVDSVLFRTGGTAAPATSGNGFLVDNFSLSSGPTPPGSIVITKYACPEGTVVTRAANGVGGTVPAGCTVQSGKTFGYVHGSQTDANAPYPELSTPLTAAGATNGSGVLTISPLPADGRYLVVETDGSNVQLPAGDILGLYCVGDGDTSGNNDNQELTFVPSGGTVNCVAYNKAPPVTVTINKYINGVQATAASANNSAFPMSATWSAINIGAGSGSYALDADGFNGNPTPYQAITSSMTSGADYTTSEVTGGATVGADCSTGQPYALVGYKSGDDLSAAQAAPISPTAPAFTNLTSSKVVLVLNKMCVPTPVHLSPANGSTLTTAAFDKADWTDVADPALPITYRYESSNSSAINLDGSFVTPVYVSGVLAISEIPTPGTPAGVYWWHVRAVDNDGNMSPWTGAWQVTVDNTPPAPPANACSTPTVAPSGYTLQNGTAGSDTVTITPFTMFVGKGGNDTVTGPDGNYIICTGNGSDTITLGHGDYTVDAGKGNNTITTGNGAGPITTGAGNDIITTGDGAHTINAGNGNNTIVTGNGSQTVTTGTGNDKVTTGSGADTIVVGKGNNTVTSGAGSDSITAGGGNDNLNGGADADTCSAGGGSNILTSCNP